MPDIRKLKRELDKVFSNYIRLRDSDSKGYVSCITCGRVLYYKDLDCGHFISRKDLANRFDEKNANGQCKSCNQFLQGNLEAYERMINIKWGKNTSEELIDKKNTVSRITYYEYEEMIRYYKERVEILKSNKILER